MAAASGPPVLSLAAAEGDRILAHAERLAPEECCGILLGERRVESAAVARVEEVRQAENVAPDRRRRYDIDPRALLDAHREARQSGRQVVGYYHSHPAGPPRPSAVDRQRAWPGVSYLIVSPDGPRPTWGSWRLEAEDGEFIAERIDWR